MKEEEEIRNLIWIEPKIQNNEDYDSYLNQLKAVGKYTIQTFYDVEGGLKRIFQIEFEESIIILSGELINEFYTKLIKKGLKDLFIIPRIFIFSIEEKTINQIKSKEKYLTLPFFNPNYIFSQFDKILEELNINHVLHLFARNEKFIFQSINDKNELIFPINFTLFASKPSDNEIKRFNNFIHYKYQNSKIDYLVNQTLSTKVPLELLMKYWIRLYSYNEFSEELNDNLRSEIGNAFDVYLRFIYYGVKEKKIESCSNKKYYRGGKLSTFEIDYINKLLQNKKENLPSCICYSKIFLIFSLDEQIALTLMALNQEKLEKNEKLVLLEIDKGNEFDENKATNVDLSKLSKYQNRKEVLFFPFSCFEISEIKNEIKFKYNYTRIKLNYLGKYQKLIPEQIEKWENISYNSFVKDFTQSVICDKYELDKISEKNPEIIMNFITAKYRIGKENLNKEIQIINCDKDKKRIEELEKICQISLQGEKKKFSLTYKFDKEGEYTFKFIFNSSLTNCSYLFNQCSTLFFVNLKNFEMNKVTNLSYMFSQCNSLTELDLSNLIGNDVENMSFMFNGCNKLKSLNLHHFQPKNKVDCRSLFSKCTNLSTIDLTLFKIKGTIKSEKMFENVSKSCKINSNEEKLLLIFKDQTKK